MLYQSNAMYRLSLCLAILAGTSSCAALHIHLHNSSVKMPSNVALYFSVETSSGGPVPGLKAKDFRIYEDGRLISPYESNQTILNPEMAVVHYVVLLLDLSGSITESGSLPTLMDAAGAFVDRIVENKSAHLAIYGFDGSEDIHPVIGFTRNAAAAKAALARLRKHRPRDPSTNLNGAVLASTQVLERRLEKSSQPLRFATLVAFTDGTDRAHRVSDDEMLSTLAETDVNVFAIGLGGEISPSQLGDLGGAGFVLAEGQDNLMTAFNHIAELIEGAARKFYLLSYCSPARAGSHQLRISAVVAGQSGSLAHEFDATGFKPGCDPKTKPSFAVGRLSF